jgi:hypothetical protein
MISKGRKETESDFKEDNINFMIFSGINKDQEKKEILNNDDENNLQEIIYSDDNSLNLNDNIKEENKNENKEIFYINKNVINADKLENSNNYNKINIMENCLNKLYFDYSDGNYTNSSIKFYKLISYAHEPFIAYKTTSSLDIMASGDSGSEKECEDMDGDDSDEGLDDNSDDLNNDSQEESGLEDSQSFMTACPGASASFEVPDVLSENHESVSKSINQDQNLLDDKNETSVGGTDDKDYDTIAFSSNNDLDVLGLLVSLLLCIILLI